MLKNTSFVCLGAQRIFDIPLTFEDDETCRWIDPVDHQVYFTLCKQQEQWIFDKGNALGLKPQSLCVNRSYPIRYQNQSCLLYVSENEPLKQQFYYYRIQDEDEIVIGRKKGDIRFDHPLVSAEHVKLIFQNHRCYIEDLASTNGVYVNQKRMIKGELQLGDCIYIMGLQIIIGNDFLAINQKGEKLRIKARLPPFQPVDEPKSVQPVSALSKAKPQPYLAYELEPRLLKEPPSAVKQERQPLLYLLGPSLTMSLASGCSSLFMVQNLLANQQPLSMAMPSLVMAGSMLVGSLLWPLLTRRYELRKEQGLNLKREACYEAYLKQESSMLQQQLLQYAQGLKQLYVNAQTAIWPYELGTEALYVCIGIGNEVLKNPYYANEQPLQIETDSPEEKKQAFLKQSLYVREVPLLQHISRLSCFYVSGSYEDQCTYARYLLYHHVLLYAPSDAHVLIAYTESEASWLPRFLPHVFHESGYRFLCSDMQHLPKALMYLHQDQLPVLALSFAASFTEFISQNALDLPMALFAFHKHREDHAIEIHGNQGMWKQRQFNFELISEFSTVMHCLSNTDSNHHSRHFPKQIGFLAMYQAESIKRLQAEKRWYREMYEPSLQAFLGVREDGEILHLDLHERVHGPHGIIAGMTGSGKSELLITLLLSLAVNYHPYVCSFILIDYKGGGMAKALAHLPHLAGVITNLDGAMIERSLTSLHVEVLRRQQLFAQVMESGGYPSMDIDVYQRLYHEHKVTQIVPHLVIAADEFAELKQQEPQFMEQLIRIARIGRSLGIHLILATQKPSGVVDDQIWSNARFHICLKVAEQNDSMDMLKRGEGAKIKAVGRFYLQVGYDEVFIEGQSAYAKLPYDPDHQGLGQSLIKELADDGSVQREWQRAYARQVQSEMNAVIEELNHIAHKHQVAVPHLWVEPLPDKLFSSDLTQGSFGLVDDPKNQRQYELSIEDNLCNTLMLGHDVSSLRKAIHAYLSALCVSNHAVNYRIVIIDAANGRLLEWKENSRIYAAITPEEKEDFSFLLSFFNRLREQKEKDKKWLLIVHNVAALLDACEEANQWLTRLARDHGNNGIHILCSAMTITDMPSRLFQQFENLLVFHLQDEQECRNLVQTAVSGSVQMRAVHKQQEQLHTVQIAENDEIVRCEEALERLPVLEEEISYSALCKEMDQGLLLGRSYLTRKPIALPMEGCWIISGYQWRSLYELLQKMAQIKQYPITFTTELEEASHTGMCIIGLSPQALSMNFHHPKLQECSMSHRILWSGQGLNEYRYLWNLDSSFQTNSRHDICWINEEAIVIRGISRYE